MTGLDSIRELVADFLNAQGIAAACAWPSQQRKRETQPFVLVSLRGCEGGPASLQDYLGERYNTETGHWQELYGKRVKLTFGLTLYAPPGQDMGEPALRALFDRMVEAFNTKSPPGLRTLSLSCGETQFDEGAELLSCPAEAVCQAFLYAITDEGGAFLDFEIKGEANL